MRINFEKRNFSLGAIMKSYTILLLMPLFLLASCGESQDQSGQVPQETMNSGSFTVYCESGISALLESPLANYQKDYPNVKLTIKTVNSRQAMSFLLSGQARVALIARDYLHDEDSLMKVYKVTPHQRMKMCDDALVFFVKEDNPIKRILDDNQLRDYFTNRNAKFSDVNIEPKNSLEKPEFIIQSHLSSEYANLDKMVAKGKKIEIPLKFMSSPDSVKNYVAEHSNAIGIGYLSQIWKDIRFKAIDIGFHDSSGAYIYPQIVHQGNIVQKKYPYIVPIYAYMLEDRRNLPWWFGIYLSKEGKIQKYFLDAGLVPGYAIIKGIQEE
ncbi:MAG: ABC-type phosphate transport system, periplasmic component [Ignavibacteria bacterium]|nr:ABC-type phosphate transport system, periplasmic component [Ignavibacteria bacterium]